MIHGWNEGHRANKPIQALEENYIENRNRKSCKQIKNFHWKSNEPFKRLSKHMPLSKGRMEETGHRSLEENSMVND